MEAPGAAAAKAEDLPFVPWAHPPPPPELPPRPSQALVVPTIVLLTVGTLTPATAGVCQRSGRYDDTCVGALVGVGAGMVAVGGALLTIHLVRRARFRAAQKQPPPRPPTRVGLAPSLGGGLLLWSGSF